MSLSEVFNRENAVPAVSYEQVRPLLRSVFAWMLAGLLITTGVALLAATNPALLELRATPGIALGSFVLQIILVFALSLALPRLSPAVAAALFLAYSALMGFSLSTLFFYFDLGSLITAFATAAILFGVMAIFGFTTDVNLMQFRNLLLMGLIGLIVAMLVNAFLASSAFDFILSIVGVVIFMGLTAYDMQNMKRLTVAIQAQGGAAELVTKYSIYGALALYLDFINIFLFLLRIMGGGRR
jgi:FtsH-binding integral membrane protein